jgi:hypothetical protein
MKLTCGGDLVSGEHSKCRRFPRTVDAEEAEALTGLDTKAEASYSGQPPNKYNPS